MLYCGRKEDLSFIGCKKEKVLKMQYFGQGKNRIWSGKGQGIFLLTEGGHRVMNKQDVLFLPYDLQSRKRYSCLGIPGKYFGV